MTTLTTSYTPPAVRIPTKCDECKELCTSQCVCGENYCSRKCLRKAWPEHCQICELVAENNEIALVITQFEMEEKLSPQELMVAMGEGSGLEAAARNREQEAQKARDEHRRKEEALVEQMLASATDIGERYVVKRGSRCRSAVVEHHYMQCLKVVIASLTDSFVD